MRNVSIKEIRYYFSIKLPAMAKGKWNGNLVRVHWGRGLNNFGDCLSPLILDHFGLTPVYTQHKDTDVVLVGSILKSVPKNYGGIILGTGGGDFPWHFPCAKVLAVRGRLTLNNLQHEHKEDIILGDPGLIMSYVLPEKVAVTFRLGIVPHFVDWQHPHMQNWRRKFGDNVLFINPLEDPVKVITQIKRCAAIVSSSLHGLVIADSFDIPNVRFVIRETMPTYEYDFKYHDYYSAVSLVPDPIEVNGNETQNFLLAAVAENKQAVAPVKDSLYSLLRETCYSLLTNGY